MTSDIKYRTEYTPSFLPTFLPWIEGKIPGKSMTTMYIGGIEPSVSDDLVQKLLESCGALTKWKRVLDASGKPKPFGFAEYTYADGLDRAMRLLPDYPFQPPHGKPLSLKVDDSTKSYIQKYNKFLSIELEQNPKILISSSTKEMILWKDILVQLDQQARQNISNILDQYLSKSTMDMIQQQLDQVRQSQPHSIDTIKQQIFQQEQDRLKSRENHFSNLYRERLAYIKQSSTIKKSFHDHQSLSEFLMHYDDDIDTIQHKNHRSVHQELDSDIRSIS